MRMGIGLGLGYGEFTTQAGTVRTYRISKGLEARYHYGEVMQEVWYPQGTEMVEALINSMPKRCQAVIDANGGWTKY